MRRAGAFSLAVAFSLCVAAVLHTSQWLELLCVRASSHTSAMWSLLDPVMPSAQGQGLLHVNVSFFTAINAAELAALKANQLFKLWQACLCFWVFLGMQVCEAVVWRVQVNV